MKGIFIVWGRELELSKNLASALDLELKQVYFKKIGNINIPTWLRYVIQAAVTIFVLVKKGPKIIYVQNPPVFAPLIIYFYSLASGSKFAIDSHTAAFLDSKWKKFYGLFKFVAKRAVLNTCHNYKNLEILKSWGIKPAMVVQFFNPAYDEKNLVQPLANDFLNEKLSQSSLPIIMVNRFASDDDYETVIAAAKLMPEATFFITGDNSGKVLEKVPNVVYTGYLQHQEFLKLMNKCKTILAFTLRPDTVLWSIREIMALRKPFVTTDSEVLRHYFSEVGVFTKSEPLELKQKIYEAIKKENEIKIKIDQFLIKDKERWNLEISEVKKILKMIEN